MRLFVDSKFVSPYALSAFVALRVKGLDVELDTIDLATRQNLDDDFFQTSVTSRVPTLIVDNFSISESSAIAEYLEELQPTPNLYPQNIQDRAKARQVQAWLRSDLLALRQDRPTEVIFYKPIPEELTPAGKIAADKLIKTTTLLLKDGRPNLFGSWSIADVDLALMLNRLIFNGDSVPNLLKQYAAQQWQHPAIQEWMDIKRPAEN
jgi:glutathione S-transferase